jgi:hypothetical protein
LFVVSPLRIEGVRGTIVVAPVCPRVFIAILAVSENSSLILEEGVWQGTMFLLCLVVACAFRCFLCHKLAFPPRYPVRRAIIPFFSALHLAYPLPRTLSSALDVVIAGVTRESGNFVELQPCRGASVVIDVLVPSGVAIVAVLVIKVILVVRVRSVLCSCSS